MLNKLKKIVLIGASYCVNWVRFRYHKVHYEQFPHTRGIILVSGKKSSISIGNKAIINSGRKMNPVGLGFQTSLITIENGNIAIGNNVGMSNVSIVSRESIVIGDNVLIGNGVCIWDTDYHDLSYVGRIIESDRSIVNKPICISEGAFIGAGSIILKGVTIGEHSIVGAGSVVTKNIPSHQIWAGNPAVYIRNTID